ncbi:MAG: hypothetical protein KDA57_15945 [Planctomycetales bacterium]|nr:hypothetical protein [Planctomycetales bacterium]
MAQAIGGWPKISAPQSCKPAIPAANMSTATALQNIGLVDGGANTCKSGMPRAAAADHAALVSSLLT